MSEGREGTSASRSAFYKYLGVIGIVCIVASFLMGDSSYANIVGAFGFAAIIMSFIDEYRTKRKNS